MNRNTALEEIIADLEASIYQLKQDNSYWLESGLTQATHTYRTDLTRYQNALNYAIQLKGAFIEIERGL